MPKFKWTTWGEVFNHYVSKGWDKAQCAQMADEWEKKNKPKLEHIASPDCWCEPELDYVDPETGNEVWVHREIH